MENTDDLVSKNFKDFCLCIPKHLNKWETQMETILQYSKGVLNLAEQLQNVYLAEVNGVDKETKNKLLYRITTDLEEDLFHIVESMNKLKLSNLELKSKLTKLEESSLNLYWNDSNSFIKGNPTVPRLETLLPLALEFYTYFNVLYKSMRSSINSIDFYDEETVKNFEKSIKNVNLKHKNVQFLVAITQYVNNENIS